MKRIISFILTLSVVLGGFVALNIESTVDAALNMNDVMSYNTGMRAIPVTTPITIDGNLDDWDRSGAIHMFKDIKARDVYNNEMALMYDKEYLYFYNKMTDDTPAENYMDPVLESERSWMGDSIQLRVATDKSMWIDVTYHHQFDQASVGFDIWKNATSATDGNEPATYVTPKGGTELKIERSISNMSYVKENVAGEMAVKIAEDNKSYVFEYKLKWTTLYDAVPEIKAGTKLRIGVDTNYGTHGKAGRVTTYQDNLVKGKYPSGFFCNWYDAWGPVELVAGGNLEPVEYVADETLSTGSIPIDVTVPSDAKLITLVMNDANGKRLCTLLAEHQIEDKDVVKTMGDKKVVRYLWDGTHPETKLMVGAGKYQFQALTHNGLNLTYDTHFYNPAKIPWGTGNNESWLADHVPPRAITSGGGKMYIASIMTEGGSAMMEIEEDGTKNWGIVRGAREITYHDGYLYAINGDSSWLGARATGDGYIIKVQASTGVVESFVDEQGKPRPMDYPFSSILGMRNNSGIIPESKGIAVNNDYIFLSMGSVNDGIVAGRAHKYAESVAVLDKTTLNIKKRIFLDGVGELAADKNGTIYAAATDGIYRIDYKSGKAVKLNLKNIPDDFAPTSITTNNDNNIVVFDNGSDKQIKVFDKDTYALIYTMGQKGGRPLQGDWEEQGLTRFVSDMAVDSQNNIWVTEKLNYPRRISVWGQDGKLVRDYIGPTDYTSSMSIIHETNEDLAYYGPVEMKLNREDNTYEITRILWLPEEHSYNDASAIDNGKTGVFDGVDADKPDPTFEMTYGSLRAEFFTSDISGKETEYCFFGVFSNSELNILSELYAASVLFMERDDGLYYPCMAIGPAEALGIDSLPGTSTSETHGKVNALWPTAGNSSTWSGQYIRSTTPVIWQDKNADGRIQNGEYEPFLTGSYSRQAVLDLVFGYWSSMMSDDFEFVAGCQGTSPIVITPSYFKEDGQPIYDLSYPNTIQFMNLNDGGNGVKNSTAICIYEDSDGVKKVLNVDGGAIQSFDYNTRKLIWHYPNQYMGVPGSQKAPMPTPGYINGALKVLGIVETEGGMVFAIRGNNGQDFYLTEDGFFIESIFEDQRVGFEFLGGSYEDMKARSSINSISNGSEPFGGILVNQNGKIRTTVASMSQVGFIANVEGFDKIKRSDIVTLNITQKILDDARAYSEEAKRLQAEVNKKDEVEQLSEYLVKKVNEGDIVLDGTYADWDSIEGLNLETTGIAERGTAKVAHDGKNLYAMVEMLDNTPMVNGASDYQILYKYGDVFDIQLSPSSNKSKDPADGDERIMISMYKGEPVVVLGRQKYSRAGRNESFTYASPVTAITHDQVIFLDEAEVIINRLPSSAVVEVKIPFDSIGLEDVKSGDKIGADIGIITSDLEGKKNNARIYYWNKDTGLVADMPLESVLHPDKWGTFKFE